MADEQTIKLRLKTAQVEIEYEGSESFLRSDLLGILDEIAETHKSNPPIEPTNLQVTDTQSDSTSNIETDIKLTIRSIASKLNVKTGTDLILAACIYLALVAKHDIFRRDDIQKEMKNAASYFKKSYISNFGNSLNTLIRSGKIHEQEKDVYALPIQVRSEMEAKLGI